MIDLNKLESDLREAIEQGLIYVGDEVHGFKPATDVRWQRLLFATRKTLVIEAGPEGKDTLDERNN